MCIKVCRALLFLVIALIFVSCKMEVSMPAFDLNGSEWWVEDIGGRGVIDRSHTTLAFVEAGAVAGDTGCNRYRGSVEILDDAISFGPMAGTRKACPPALMDQETKFYQAVARVASWEVRDTGLLHLLDAQGVTVIRASQVEK